MNYETTQLAIVAAVGAFLLFLLFVAERTARGHDRRIKRQCARLLGLINYLQRSIELKVEPSKLLHVDAVFDHWTMYDRISKQVRVVEGAKYIELTAYNFHGGSMFRAVLLLEESDAKELTFRMRNGYQPNFWLSLPPNSGGGDGKQ